MGITLSRMRVFFLHGFGGGGGDVSHCFRESHSATEFARVRCNETIQHTLVKALVLLANSSILEFVVRFPDDFVFVCMFAINQISHVRRHARGNKTRTPNSYAN